MNYSISLKIEYTYVTYDMRSFKRGSGIRACLDFVNFFSDWNVIRKARTIFDNSILARILDTIEYYFLNPQMLEYKGLSFL